MAAIFNNSRWLPLIRSNISTNALHHLYKNLKFSKLYKFYEVRNPPTILHVNYRVREPHVSHTGINVYAHCPLHLPKIVSKKPSVNHIGSSTSTKYNSIFVFFQLNLALSLDRTRNQWGDLGIHTEACMTRPQTCGTAGGAISLWINVVECPDSFTTIVGSVNANFNTGSAILCGFDRIRYDMQGYLIGRWNVRIDLK